MIRRITWTCLAFLPAITFASASGLVQFAEVSVFPSGAVFLNGQSSSLPAIEAAIKSLKSSHGIMLYYEENSYSKPPPGIKAVASLADKYGLPFSRIAKPVFDLPRDSFAKVSVLASGELWLNGEPSSLAAIETAFQRLASKHGNVFCYGQETVTQPPEASAILSMAAKYGLPVWEAQKPDFSDRVEGNGHLKPLRRQ